MKISKVFNYFKLITWIIFFIYSVLLYVGNHNYPKGDMIPSGEIVCSNPNYDTGTCGEQFIEDVNMLDIPKWVMFIKSSLAELLWYVILISALMLTERNIYHEKHNT